MRAKVPVDRDKEQKLHLNHIRMIDNSIDDHQPSGIKIAAENIFHIKIKPRDKNAGQLPAFLFALGADMSVPGLVKLSPFTAKIRLFNGIWGRPLHTSTASALREPALRPDHRRSDSRARLRD
jgi:hypothetical protein